MASEVVSRRGFVMGALGLAVTPVAVLARGLLPNSGSPTDPFPSAFMSRATENFVLMPYPMTIPNIVMYADFTHLEASWSTRPCGNGKFYSYP